MPAILLLFGGGALGFVLGRGADGASNLVKWTVIGGGVYVAAKALKVL